MKNNFLTTALILLMACLTAHAEMPDFEKIFDRNETIFISKMDIDGDPVLDFVTNEEWGSLKAKFIKAMGKDWKEIPRYDAGNKTDILGNKRKKNTHLLGDIRMANPKQPKQHVVLALFNFPDPDLKTKYSMLLFVDSAPPKVEEAPKKD